MSNVINAVVHDANTNKTFVSMWVWLKKHGRCAKLNGKVYDVKTSRNGKSYLLLENFLGKTRQDGRRWQTVPVNSIISIKKDKKVYVCV